MIITSADDLDRPAIVALARGSSRLTLAPALLASLAANRALVLAALDGDRPVYGVNTGMGALAGVRLDAAARDRHQNTLMLGRAVGSAPWLDRASVRALLAVRLRTFLHPAAGVSPELCLRLALLLNEDVVPDVPARGSGAAGEIIPLAHLGAAVLEAGAYSFGAKEGVAFLEGVPGLTGMAALGAADARSLVEQIVAASGTGHAIVGASRDPWHPSLAQGDPVLAELHAALLAHRGDGPVRALQAPVSFRVTAPALAAATRAADAVAAAADRALAMVTDSPAYLDGDFVGSAGFAGTDLATACAGLTTALIHLAELGASRLHRLLDPALTGLPRQLSDAPGVHAGMVAVHKRAVGVAHRLRRFAVPAVIGVVETSLGQEDAQSFTFEVAECLREAVTGVREVLACELLALHQARLLSAEPVASAVLDGVAAVLPPGTADRPFGRDIDALIIALEHGRLG
ncbi:MULTISPECIES: aromatic amino acid lyase [Actinoplanes]|uniref:aromatic amino acid lyase n=1 Tax=Actinoplanes TaxID=1865 RepID=UPI0005F2ED9C|nr:MULTISPECIES: aromatic amino acid lyase [Actinoplanes]GLY08417.1 histidine ammonia-lyase [Actinoplanes sp. NBRC 101535]